MNPFIKTFSLENKRKNLKMSLVGIMLMFLFSYGLEVNAQSTQATYMNPAPSGKTWVSPNVAFQTVEAEVLLLTTQLNQLIQSGANSTVIGKKDTELQFYKAIQQMLNAGQHISWAIQEAYILVGGEATSDAGGQHPFMSLAELKSMRDMAITKFTY